MSITSAQNADEIESRLKLKIKTIESRLPSWQGSGHDPTIVADQMRQFDKLMQAGQVPQAERILDKILIELKEPKITTPVAASSMSIPFTDETQFLIFMLSGSGIYEATSPYAVIDKEAKVLKQRIGATGTSKRKLGFGIVIPIWMVDRAFPEKVPVVIRDAFRVAREQQMAILFSVESHYHWETRPDLWNFFDRNSPGFNGLNKNNVEWSDWQGTPYRHRFLDWGSPQSMAPPMCINAPKIKSELTRLLGKGIGPSIKEAVKKLGTDSEQLFAGITVTAEPMIENYSIVDSVNPHLAEFMQKQGAPKVRLGFNALTNTGYSQTNPPKNFEDALAKVNQDFGAYCAEQFKKSGIPSSRLYTHVAANGGVPGTKICAFTNAPISVAFNKYCRPGWTTYAAGPLQNGLAPIYKELALHGDPHWGSSEASPIALGGPAVAPYEYLRWHYAHGATLVVMNTGATSSELTQELERGVFGPASIAAYKRFLGQRP